MQGILVIIDGMGDLPNPQLNNKTPLEAALTPNMDFLATRGEMGFLYPVKPGFVPESDESIISIFGNDLFFGSRGQFEAIGEGVSLTRGDLALRANFSTINSLKEGNILDRRTGRTLTYKEIDALSSAINKIKLPCNFMFKPTILHQAVLVVKGGFSENILGNDATYIQGKSHSMSKIKSVRALEDEDNSLYTANILNDFLKKSHEVLETHPINEDRRKKGLLPANYLLLRSPGIEPPKIKQYKKWLAISYFPLEKGFSKVSNMDLFSFDYPKLKDFDSYSNIWEGLRYACDFAVRTIKNHHRNYNYCYVHINEPDIAGHDNKPIEKKLMLEYIDSTLFKFLREFAPPNNIHVVLTANHSTPCRLKDHSDDPVPVLFYNSSIPREKHFNETEARKGSMGRILGKELLKKVGFVK